jgi:Mn-containing catalase
MRDIRSAASFFSYGGGAVPVNSNSMSWNVDMVTTTGNVVFDLLHNFHLECGARLHKLRVYESLDSSDATGREVCGYLIVRGGVHAHAYALALKKLTGVSIEQMLPTPNIPSDRIPECQKYLQEGAHRRLYTFSTGDYEAMRGVWEGEMALPDDPPGELVVVEGMPEGGKIHDLTGMPSAFAPDYAPEEMFEIATRLTKAAHQGAGSL